jgi:hypothetical protein
MHSFHAGNILNSIRNFWKEIYEIFGSLADGRWVEPLGSDLLSAFNIRGVRLFTFCCQNVRCSVRKYEGSSRDIQVYQPKNHQCLCWAVGSQTIQSKNCFITKELWTPLHQSVELYGFASM